MYKEVEDLLYFFFARKFMTKSLSKKPTMRVLPEAEKLDFLKTSVSWIKSKDIMDTCFVLNFGYEFPLPWPKVHIIRLSDNFFVSVNYNYNNGRVQKRPCPPSKKWEQIFFTYLILILKSV